MGLTISSIFARFLDIIYGNKKYRIVMFGLDSVGKTTTLYKLKLLNETFHTIPTVGFNLETIQYKNISFTMCDVGGGDKIRGLWYHYFKNTHGIIFIIDSTDRERIGEVSDELNRLLHDDRLDENAIILIFANKQDLPNAMNVEQIINKLKLFEGSKHRWFIQPTSAIKGEGLYEGLELLANELNNNKFKY